ncbi:hypothetical protein [Lignipirellula cremea]|uniref:Uncharacterized protein n=1 Tax=Lignipirellula cremea TaxID=2528010 RepID=A0A518DMN9_9BACT|nr:hypothetical protein [Lignipirellula cremea]QDU93081.1 hypothetical protein Pla8534_08600 [Lignipirellula cremea]
MFDARRPTADEVEHLLLNAQLRSDIEPYLDESVDLLKMRTLSTPEENDFLASMLAWERAPVLRISQWFEPELILPSPDLVSDLDLSTLLWDTLQRLYERKIVLDFTEHLSDRQLYNLLYRDILPSFEKKVDLPKNYLHWHCLDPDEEPQQWLRYYASPKERQAWAEEHGVNPPPLEPAPYPRKMPRRAL